MTGIWWSYKEEVNLNYKLPHFNLCQSRALKWLDNILAKHKILKRRTALVLLTNPSKMISLKYCTFWLTQYLLNLTDFYFKLTIGGLLVFMMQHLLETSFSDLVIMLILPKQDMWMFAYHVWQTLRINLI